MAENVYVIVSYPFKEGGVCEKREGRTVQQGSFLRGFCLSLEFDFDVALDY